MRRFGYLVLAVGTVAWSTGPTYGQFVSGSDGPQIRPVNLVQDKEVQEELKLTPEQVKKVKALFEEMRQQVRKRMEDAEKLDPATQDDREKRFERRRKSVAAVTTKATQALSQILSPEQVKRVNQIGLQRLGVLAFNDPEVQQELRLTPEQKGKLKEITAKEVQDMRNSFPTPQVRDAEETRKKVIRRRQEAMEKALAVLSAEQREKWQDLMGFEFEPMPFLAKKRPSSPVNNRRQFTVAGPRPTTAKDELSWVEKQVDEWQPSNDERRVDDIGWVKSLREALRLGKEHNRPILVFTYNGKMEAGRC
jgi:Spy/CpxP family protein refolding chaperone